MTAYWGGARQVVEARGVRCARQLAQANRATPEVLAEARAWALDSFGDCPAELFPLDLVQAVERHWDAGAGVVGAAVWADFVRCVG